MTIGLLLGCLITIAPTLWLRFANTPEMTTFNVDDIVCGAHKGLQVASFKILDPQNDLPYSSPGGKIMNAKSQTPSRPIIIDDDYFEIIESPGKESGASIDKDGLSKGMVRHLASGDDDYPISIAEIMASKRYNFREFKIHPFQGLPERPVIVNFPTQISNLPDLDPSDSVIVILRLSISNSGAITELDVLYEYPANKGFADKLKNAIKFDSYIAPAIKNGMPVASEFLFSWQYKADGGVFSAKSTDDVCVSLIK
jgi:hypothetical protein